LMVVVGWHCHRCSHWQYSCESWPSNDDEEI
jgi:hypothetical protein